MSPETSARATLPPPPPLPAEPAPPPPETIGPFLTAQLRTQQARLQATCARVLAMHDEDAVHDLRVALRRMRTLLEIGRRIFGRFRTDQVRRAFGDLQRATGALRDEEVLHKLLGSQGLAAGHADVPRCAAEWLAVRRRREHALRNEVRRVVRAGDPDRALRLLDALLAFAIKPSREKGAAKFARRALEGAGRAVARRQDAPTSDAPALHRLRIAYKRLRYTAETFAEATGADAGTTAEAAARFQGLLGRIHDADVAIHAVTRARAMSSAGRTALLQALTEVRAARLSAYEKAAAVALGSTTPPRLHASGTVSLRKISTR